MTEREKALMEKERERDRDRGREKESHPSKLWYTKAIGSLIDAIFK